MAGTELAPPLQPLDAQLHTQRQLPQLLIQAAGTRPVAEAVTEANRELEVVIRCNAQVGVLQPELLGYFGRSKIAGADNQSGGLGENEPLAGELISRNVQLRAQSCGLAPRWP